MAGCYDALSAKILSGSGHKAAFLSGYAVSSTARFFLLEIAHSDVERRLVSRRLGIPAHRSLQLACEGWSALCSLKYSLVSILLVANLMFMNILSGLGNTSWGA